MTQVRLAQAHDACQYAKLVVTPQKTLGAWEFQNSTNKRILVVVGEVTLYIYNYTNNNYSLFNLPAEIEEVDGCIQLYDSTIVIVSKDIAPQVITNAFSTPSLQNITIAAPNISNVYITASGSSAIYSCAYILTYYTADGSESLPSQKFGFWREGDVATRTLNNLPVPTDQRVVGKRLYRTMLQTVSGTEVGVTFYRLADLSNSETTFVDNIPDSSLDLGKTVTYYNNIALARTSVLHKNRLFLGNIRINDFNPYKLMFFSKSATLNSSRRGTLVTKVGINIPLFTSLPFISPHYRVNGGSSGIPKNTIADYRIYLKTADGRYSDYFYQIEFEVDSSTYTHYTVIFYDTLWTAFFGAGNFSVYPEWDTIEIYGKSNVYSNKYRRIKTFKIRGGQNPSDTWVTDNGGFEADNLNLPNITTLGFKDYPSAIVFSEPSEPTSFPSGNRLMINLEDGGAITKLISQPDGVLVIKSSGQYKIFTESVPIGWRLYGVSNVGVSSPHFATSNAKQYFLYDGRFIRTNDDRIISLQISGWMDLLSNPEYTLSRLLSTDRYLIVNLRRQNQYRAVSNTLLIYDIELNSWYRWVIGGTYGGGCMPVGYLTQRFPDFYVVSDLNAEAIERFYICEYDSNKKYDEIYRESIFPFLTSIKTKVFKLNDNQFRFQKLIINCQISEFGTIYAKLNNISTDMYTNSGYQKYLIPDTNNGKKSETAQIEVIGDIDRLDSIKLIYTPIRGRYGE